MEQIINKILNYINKNYQVNAIIKTKFNNKYNIFVETQKYDLNITLKKAYKGHYLFGKVEYVLSFNFEANKKHRTELSYHGGGHSDGYYENDFTNIDNFLNRFCEKKKYEQTTIFDFLGGQYE